MKKIAVIGGDKREERLIDILSKDYDIRVLSQKKKKKYK